MPLVELDKSLVEARGKSVRLRKDSKKRNSADCSFGNFKEHLGFDAWQFFHAAKKTELASSFSEEQLNNRAFAFALEHERTFVWDSSNFRKIDRNTFALEDFASAGLAGRVGEAIAYLTMVKWGYVFWDRCTTVWLRAARRAKVSHNDQLRVARYLASKVSSGKPANEPDFVFEKLNSEVALMEAKGSFLDPGRDKPTVKQDLRQALSQLSAWSEVIAPAPGKSFGIGTYLREESDNVGDPSLIAFVDPRVRKKLNFRPVEFPRDLIRRCNYGSWLMGMGLVSSGRALRDLRAKPADEFSLPVLRIANRDFAVTAAGWKLELESEFSPWWWRNFPYSHWSEKTWLMLGIDANILRQLGAAIRNPEEPVLLRLEAQQAANLTAENRANTWSIMPDGSFVGVISRDKIADAFQSMQTFTL